METNIAEIKRSDVYGMALMLRLKNGNVHQIALSAKQEEILSDMLSYYIFSDGIKIIQPAFATNDKLLKGD